MIGPLCRIEERPVGFIWLLVAEQTRDAANVIEWRVSMVYDPLPHHERYWPRRIDPLVMVGATRIREHDAAQLDAERDRLRRMIGAMLPARQPPRT